MSRRGERNRDKELYWRRMVKQWQRSGLSVRAFCAQHGLAEASFYAWRRIITQLKQESAPDPAMPERDSAETGGDHMPRFVPVRVVDAPVPLALEVVLQRGRMVRVRRGFDADTLRQLLAVLEEDRPC